MRVRYCFFLLLLTQTLWAQDAYNASGREIIVQNEAEFQDGRDYFSYTIPIKNTTDTENKIKLLSFFDYDCRVCINTQDILTLYSQINPNSVIVEEYPVATPKTLFSARVYYSLKQMQHEDLSDLLLFETADATRYREISKYENLLAWLKQQNVDIQRFNEVYNSKETAQKIEQAILLTEKYGVFTYPFVVIEGQYVLTNSTLYNDDYTFAVLDFLVRRLTEQKERKE